MPIKELPIGYLEWICRWTSAFRLTTSLLCSHTQTATKLCHSRQDVFLWENLRVTLDVKGRLGLGMHLRPNICLTTVRTWAWCPEWIPRIHKERAGHGWELETSEVCWERGAEAGPSLEAPDQLAWSLGKVPGQRQILSWETKRRKAPRKRYSQWCPPTSAYIDAHTCTCLLTYMHCPAPHTRSSSAKDREQGLISPDNCFCQDRKSPLWPPEHGTNNWKPNIIF